MPKNEIDIDKIISEYLFVDNHYDNKRMAKLASSFALAHGTVICILIQHGMPKKEAIKTTMSIFKEMQEMIIKMINSTK